MVFQLDGEEEEERSVKLDLCGEGNESTHNEPFEPSTQKHLAYDLQADVFDSGQLEDWRGRDERNIDWLFFLLPLAYRQPWRACTLRSSLEQVGWGEGVQAVSEQITYVECW